MIEGTVGQFLISGFSAVFVVVGAYQLNRGRIERAKSHRIARTETTDIRNLQPGTAEVKGRVRPAEDATTLSSPISEEPALATRVEVEEWESSGQGGGSWETTHEQRNAVPLLVDDGTGTVRVELPADGELNVEKTRTEVGSGDEPPAEITRYLEHEAAVEEASRRSIGPLSIGERRRYSEGWIAPDEEIYVLGRAREERGGWGERAYVIDESTASGDFILSDKSEAELVREGKRGGLVTIGIGAIVTLVGLFGMLVPWL
ncbi:E3 ubiquitin ligase family protein [Halovivax limisalsi]|uniref:E3 ubiquitin ligase family protein n=1 Tax=Halovivax limisalsi TaxID=1453760 RepID=UPI001FFC7723|nr:E3 ubiquitin ligase family protein [Halovivax limisalsi]